MESVRGWVNAQMIVSVCEAIGNFRQVNQEYVNMKQCKGGNVPVKGGTPLTGPVQPC